MLKSLLPKSFQLYNHIFHVQFGSWHSGEKQELLDTGDSVFFTNTSNHFKASRYSFRAPWRLYKQLTVYVTWTIIVSCQIPKSLGQVRRTLCWNFPRQIWDIRKDKEFSPIKQSAPHTCSLQWPPVSCAQMTGHSYGTNILTFILLGSSALLDWHKALCTMVYYWGVWAPINYPFLSKPNLSQCD